MQDEVRLEAAVLNLAKQAGLKPPAFKLVGTPAHPVLLVERFDLEPLDKNRFGSRHMLTLATAASGAGRLAYTDLADALRLRADPADLARLYRQMLFNVAIGNTDDHPGNFSLLREQGMFRLSPAYDLVPQPGQEDHALDFAGASLPPDRQVLLGMAGRFDLNQAHAAALIDAVLGVCGNWQATCRDVGVPPTDLRRLEPFLSRRQTRMQSRTSSGSLHGHA